MPGGHRHDYRQNCTQSTVQEIKFLDRIGTHCDKVIRKTPEERVVYRIKCLRGYKEAAMLRTDWGGIDRYEILEHIDRLVDKLK